MGEVATAPTFLDELLARKLAFRPVEESGARVIRHEMGRVRAAMMRTIETGMETVTREGRYLTTAAAQRRAQRVVKDISDVLKRGVADVDSKLLSLKEGAFQRGLRDFEVAAEKLPGVPKVAIGNSFEQIFPEAAQAALTNPVMGIRPSMAWKGVEAGTMAQVQRNLLQAVTTGESVGQTAARLAEAMDVTQNAAERISRTGLNALYNDAHKAVINANPDIFTGYRWVAALDDRTSAICIRLHGTFFPIGTNPPGPPAHWNCRSIVQPVFRNPDIQAEMMDDRQRVKTFDADGRFKDSHIKAKTSASSWLRRQPEWVQRQVLGSELKADLFRAGKASIEDIVSPAMKVLTDKQLVRRMAALRPRDRELRALAKEKGIGRLPMKKTIRAEDRKLARGQWFEQPQAMPDPNVSPAPPPPAEAPPKPEKRIRKDPLPKGQAPTDKLLDDFERVEREREMQWNTIEILKRDQRRARSALRGAVSETSKQRHQASLSWVNKELAQKRPIFRGLTTEKDEIFAKLQGQLKPDLLPANVADDFLPLRMARTRMTSGEFGAVKGELEDLVKAHNAALRKEVPFPTIRGRPTFSRRRAQVGKQYAYHMNQALRNSADDMARARLLMLRAEREMGDFYDAIRVGDPLRAKRLFKDKLLELNRSAQYAPIKDEIVANMRSELALQNVDPLKIDRIEVSLRETLNMLNDSLYEIQDSDLWRTIAWEQGDVRSFANEVRNVLQTRWTASDDTWMHEFAHHIEYRSKSKRTLDGFRKWMAWRDGQRYGSTGNIGEDGFLDVFFDDYVGRVYPHGSTQAMSMGHQALYNSAYFRKMRDLGPEHLRMSWAVYRGWAKW